MGSAGPLHLIYRHPSGRVFNVFKNAVSDEFQEAAAKYSIVAVDNVGRRFHDPERSLGILWKWIERVLALSLQHL